MTFGRLGSMGSGFGRLGGGGSAVTTGIIAAGAGSYAWTGQDATLLIEGPISLAGEAGSYAWTGDEMTPLQDHFVTAAGGSYAWTGQDATLIQGNFVVTASGGSYAWTGQDATLTVSGGSLGLQTNLTAFFSLDNTLADATGNVTDLTNNNVVTFVTPPGSGLAAVTNCANFVNTSSQYLSHADATGINVAGINFSLQFWFYVTSSTRQFISKATEAFGSREYECFYGFGTGASNPITIHTNNGTNLVTGNVTTNAWHHFVFTRDNASNAQIVYIDGSSFASNTGSSDPTGTSTLHIGANPGLSAFMSGNLALVGTWRNRILSADDVTALYNSGSGLDYASMA